VQVKFLTEANGFRNEGGGPFRGSPVEGESLVDQPGKGSTGFLERCLKVGSVGENDIHVVELQSFETVPGALDNMFPGHERLVDFIAYFEQFSADDESLSL